MPSNSYCSQCQNMQSEMDLDKDRWIDLVFSKASAHYCAVGIFFRIGQLVIVFAVLFVIHSSDTHRPLFIEWHRQASYVLLLMFFVNVSWYTKHWHLTFTYAIPSTAVVFIPFWREKEREGYLLSPHR